MVASKSALVAFIFTAMPISWIISPASGPTMWQPTTRSLALSTISFLERLVRQGTHGTSVPGVARTLIEEGIRLAIKDGLLSIRDTSKG